MLTEKISEINLFTKSDLIKLYSQNYKGKHLVSDFMTRLVFTTHPSNSIHTVLRILMKNRISRVIVVSDDDDKDVIRVARDWKDSEKDREENPLYYIELLERWCRKMLSRF